MVICPLKWTELNLTSFKEIVMDMKDFSAILEKIKEEDDKFLEELKKRNLEKNK